MTEIGDKLLSYLPSLISEGKLIILLREAIKLPPLVESFASLYHIDKGKYLSHIL